MAKGFGDLFSDSLKEYGDKFMILLKTFAFIYFIPIVIMAVIGIILVFLTGFTVSNISSNLTGTVMLNLFEGGISALGLVLLFIFIIIYLIISVLLSISYVHISLAKKETSWKNVFKVARNFFWKYLGISILMGILLILLYLLLIIPGIIFTVYWIFAIYILMNEKLGIWESLKKSKQIVKGRWWRVFGYFLLLMLIIMAVSIVTGFIPFIGSLVQFLVITPFCIIFFKNFYLDLKGKK